MAELTNRGAEDRKREGEVIEGEPVEAEWDNGPPANVLRDKGITPAKDTRSDGRSGKKQR